MYNPLVINGIRQEYGADTNWQISLNRLMLFVVKVINSQLPVIIEYYPYS